MAYDFDYSYSDSVIDDVFDDVIVDAVEQQREKERQAAEMAARIAARQQAGAADYSGVVGGVADAIGSGIGNLYSNYGEAVVPSVTGYYGDTSPVMNDQELAGVLSMLDRGNLMASNMQGVSDSPDSQVYGGDLTLDQLLDLAATTNRDEYDRLVTEYYDKNYPVKNTSADYATVRDAIFDMDDFFPYSDEAGVDSVIDSVINSTVSDDYGYGASDEDYNLPGSVGTEEASATETGIFGGTLGPKLKNMFGGLLGALGLGGGNFLGSMIGGKGSGSPLIDYLMMKSLLKDEPKGFVPVGGQAYGGQAFNYQDYKPINLQPALMPGVAYANMAAPAMMVGGEAKQYPNKGLAALAKEAPEVVERMGYEHGGSIENRPGDITFAKLEPGEFVIQKPAVDAIGIETLRKINSMGDGRPYYG